MTTGKCACDNTNQHAACDDTYLDAPLYSPSKAQLEAERTELLARAANAGDDARKEKP